MGKVSKAQATQKLEEAKGEEKAAKKKAAELAKAAAEAQDLVKQDTVKEKVAKQNKLQATQKQKEADKAFEIHEKYVLKHEATTAVHKHWEELSVLAEKNVTDAKQVAVSAMEAAQCIIKDKRSGCKLPAWKGHCKTQKWKAWMMTHCTESCGFSCTDLHDLAMGVVLKAESEARKRERDAREEACPKYNNIAAKYAAYADKYGRMAVQYVQPCKMRQESQACKDVDKFSKMSKDFEKKHALFKGKMQKLKCYEYNGQWNKAAGSGSGAGSAAGQKLLRMMETNSVKAARLFNDRS